MKIRNTELFVEKHPGEGLFNFVLIHNAGGNHQFFMHQVPMLKKYGHVILLDLPGHGKSAPLKNLNSDILSGVIVEICQALSLENIVLVGLNNGANIVIDIAAKHLLSPLYTLLIDPPLLMEESFISEIKAFIEILEADESSNFIEDLVDHLFVQPHDFNKEVARRAFLSVERKSLQNTFQALIEWDRQSEDWLKKVLVPTLCIITDEHHCSYSKLRKKAPHFEIGKVIGSHCWATLEVPEQVNAMIERFLNLRKTDNVV